MGTFIQSILSEFSTQGASNDNVLVANGNADRDRTDILRFSTKTCDVVATRVTEPVVRALSPASDSFITTNTLNGAAEPRLRFENSSDAPVGEEPTPSAPILQVLAGRLELRDNQSAVVVETNACLRQNDQHESAEGDGLFSALMSGACD